MDALVLEGSSGEDRDEGALEGSHPDAPLEGVDVGLLSLEVSHEDLLVLLNGELDKGLAVLGGFVSELLVDEINGSDGLSEGDAIEGGSKVLSPPDNSLHGDKVNNTEEISLASDGELENSRGGSELLDDGVYAEVEVGTGAVHLVEEAHSRDVVLVSLPPDGLGLGFDSGNSVKDGDGTVKDTEGTLDLEGEVDVTGGVDDVDAVVVPGAGGGSGGDGDSTLLLLFHPVHGRTTLVNLSDLVTLSGVVKDTLRGGGLSGVDVSHDTNVTVHAKVDLAADSGGMKGGGGGARTKDGGRGTKSGSGSR